MTDREAAIAALNANGQEVSGESARYGYRTWQIVVGGHDCAVQIGDDEEWAALSVPLAAVIALLNPLTVEMVREEVERILYDVTQYDTDSDIKRWAERVVIRLRKRIEGEQAP